MGTPRWVAGLLRAESKLPMGLQLRLGAALGGLMRLGPGYRKAIVEAHLQQAFPDWPPTRRQAVRLAVYRHLGQMLTETLATPKTPSGELLKRLAWNDHHWVRQLALARGPVLMLVGHQFNWEWGIQVMTLRLQLPVLCAYMPLKDPTADQLLLEIRARHGAELAPLRQFTRRLLAKGTQPCVGVLAADQSPPDLAKAQFVPFFGCSTPFQNGAETLARKRGYPIVYTELLRLGPGRYQAQTHLAFEHPQHTAPGEITAHFAAWLEASIRRQPDNWLWTHRRWKHAQPLPAAGE